MGFLPPWLPAFFSRYWPLRLSLTSLTAAVKAVLCFAQRRPFFSRRAITLQRWCAPGPIFVGEGDWSVSPSIDRVRQQARIERGCIVALGFIQKQAAGESGGKRADQKSGAPQAVASACSAESTGFYCSSSRFFHGFKFVHLSSGGR